MIDKTHPLYETVKLVGEYSYADSRLIAEGKHAEFLQRARRRVQREYYFHGLMQGSQGVLIFYWLSQFSRWHSVAHIVWACLAATMLALDLWVWPRRRRALESALARLERDVAERSQHGEASG